MGYLKGVICSRGDTDTKIFNRRELSFKRIRNAPCVFTERKPEMIGNFDGWLESPQIYLDKKGNVSVSRTRWSQEKDFSGLLKFLWDDDNFYLAARIKDDVLSSNVSEISNYLSSPSTDKSSSMSFQ